MKSALAVLATGLVFVSMAASGAAGSASGQASAALTAEVTPTVDQVLDKYVQAVGGKSAFEKLTTRVMKGKVEVPGIGESGKVEIYKKCRTRGLPC